MTPTNSEPMRRANSVTTASAATSGTVESESWQIAPNVPHEVHAGLEGAIVIDAFAPARDDWRALEREPAQPPRWP